LSWDAREVLSADEATGDSLDWLWTLGSVKSSNPAPVNYWGRFQTRSFREYAISNDRKDPETNFPSEPIRPQVSKTDDADNVTEFGEEDFDDPKNRKLFLLESTLRELKKDNKLKEEKIVWQSNELKILRKAVETLELVVCDDSKREMREEELKIAVKNCEQENTNSNNERKDIIQLTNPSNEKSADSKWVTKVSRGVLLQAATTTANEARANTRYASQNPKQETRLIVKNLSYSVTRADLTAFLDGDVKYVQWLHTSHGEKLFTGIAFVEMATSNSAANAVAKTGTQMMGRTITVDYASANDRVAWPPAEIETKKYYTFNR
jgi:hypothetical protein